MFFFCGETEVLLSVSITHGGDHGSLHSRSCLGNYVLHTLTARHTQSRDEMANFSNQ